MDRQYGQSIWTNNTERQYRQTIQPEIIDIQTDNTEKQYKQTIRTNNTDKPYGQTIRTPNMRKHAGRLAVLTEIFENCGNCFLSLTSFKVKVESLKLS